MKVDTEKLRNGHDTLHNRSQMVITRLETFSYMLPQKFVLHFGKVFEVDVPSRSQSVYAEWAFAIILWQNILLTFLQ